MDKEWRDGIVIYCIVLTAGVYVLDCCRLLKEWLGWTVAGGVLWFVCWFRWLFLVGSIFSGWFDFWVFERFGVTVSVSGAPLLCGVGGCGGNSLLGRRGFGDWNGTCGLYLKFL